MPWIMLQHKQVQCQEVCQYHCQTMLTLLEVEPFAVVQAQADFSTVISHFRYQGQHLVGYWARNSPRLLKLNPDF